MISNNGADTASGVLYRAVDAFLGGSIPATVSQQLFSDNRNAVGCSVNPNNSPPDKIEEFIPLTGGNNYFQNEFDFVWSAIGSQVPFAGYRRLHNPPGQRGRDQLEFLHPRWRLCHILACDDIFSSGVGRARDFQDC